MQGFSPHTLGMKLSSAFLAAPLVLLASFLCIFNVLAQGEAPFEAASSTNSGEPADLYESSLSPLGIPTGDINTGIISDSIQLFSSDYTPPTATTTTNLQGCGGVGQADYTTALFNMPEIFDKFKKDVNSDLAKQILTYNYSLPQTAALFDTLNNYGNARYQQFQKACNLNALQEDAKEQYMQACVPKMVPARKQKIQNPTGGATTATPTGSELDSQAYAQAWEICAMQYLSDQQDANGQKAIDIRNDINSKFAQTTRRVENINTALKPLICPPDSSGVAMNGCWPLYFLPQVKLCNDATLDGACTGPYGVREAPLSMKAYFDFLRYVFSENIVKNGLVDLKGKIQEANISPAAQGQAASKAVYRLSAAKLPATTSTQPRTVEADIKDFQVNYLNCRNADATYPLREYARALGEKASTDSGSNTVNIQLTAADVISKTTSDLMSRLKLPSEMQENQNALRLLVDVSLGCSTNQTIPVFDPNITASISNRCMESDADTFYTMASYDVAQASTRDVYRYLNTRLKQVYARLLNETGAGLKVEETDTTPDSPELRRRLATAVKEVMIPFVESQLERIDEAEKSRGEFSRRVQRIYADRQGCVSGPASTSEFHE